MPIPGNIPGNPGMEKFTPVFPGTAFPGNTRGPITMPHVIKGMYSANDSEVLHTHTLILRECSRTFECLGLLDVFPVKRDLPMCLLARSCRQRLVEPTYGD